MFCYNTNNFPFQITHYADDNLQTNLVSKLAFASFEYFGVAVVCHLLSKCCHFVAMYGSQNTRIEELFSCIPRLRKLGVLHHNWTVVHIMNRERNMTSATGTPPNSSPLYSPDLPPANHAPLFKQAPVQCTSTLTSPRTSVTLQQQQHPQQSLVSGVLSSSDVTASTSQGGG